MKQSEYRQWSIISGLLQWGGCPEYTVNIIVSAFGTFVIGTKNMKGWIFGSEHQKQWTQKIF
ncbi:nuclease-related domain-containing protein [Endozoicomonas acroporae]|uniref:nuclease-related domain-containing protein n=1 Tax=Endozoicomonas acroporae TaxID=1701104 RepID=UPI001F505E91|nr:nuclease-related domain-containing protein [Endozoicomonas acroporae]